MSRADWSFLEHLLEEGQEYSTGVGRIWLTVLFLFRMLVLGTAAESAWDDEQADFVCNTLQPGCTAVCYDKAFPISHFRYFVLQVIFVSTPTIFYFGYVAVRARKDKRGKEDDEEKRTEGGDVDNVAKRTGEHSSSDAPKLKGRLLCAYAFSIFLKVLLEAGFMVGLWFLYDGFFIAAKFECVTPPCPHTVDCFVSRPTEKTIFTIYTQAIAGISLLLNLIELLHLLQLGIGHCLEKRYRHATWVGQVPPQEVLPMEVLQSHKEGSHVHLPAQGEDPRYTGPCESNGDLTIEVNWGPGGAGGDLLPSYINCMAGMRSTHSPRVLHQGHGKHIGKPHKGTHKGQSKQKHYV
ncbi:connexin 39.4 [Thalassophryne amazonica]|uniref:connexin 39.4 n=1 Tax=Thalassophryne amazonica TaxID=390379 RepID=UPI001470F98E|nr:connexin 39.4 [Thalassophryne amazonica]